MNEMKDEATEHRKPSTFRKSLDKDLNNLLSSLVDNQRWNLCTYIFIQHQNNMIIYRFHKHSKESVIQKKLSIFGYVFILLFLDWNHMPSMITLVVIPTFDKLRIMNIGGNDILTVEPLSKARWEGL